MTNREKLKEMFPNTIFIYQKEEDKTKAILCSDEWLDREYKEPTTKNDLGVNAVSRQAVIDTIFEECSGTKLDIDFAKVLMLQRAIKALPPATPQELKWIPVSERLPKDLEPVNITWINHDPESYYNDIKDKPFTATGVYFNGQWYWWSTLCTDILAEYSHNYDDIVDDDIEITAWQPLPQSFEPQESEDKE